MTGPSLIAAGQSSLKKRQMSGNTGQLSCGRSRTMFGDGLGERCAAWLRRRYPDRTADNVAADTGLKAETIAKMLQRESDPSGAALTVMIAVYGPDFLGTVLPNAPAWLSGPSRMAEAEGVLAELEGLRARLIASLPADGR